MRMLPMNFLGVPVIRQMILNNLNDFGRRAGNRRHTIRADSDMGVTDGTHNTLRVKGIARKAARKCWIVTCEFLLIHDAYEHWVRY